jgi:mannan endo-1,4-beta-mannosidase
MDYKQLPKIMLLKLVLGGISLLNIHAQIGQTIYVDGSHIMGPCSDTLWFKGVNYAPYNWGYSPSELRIDEVAQTGANCIRLPWYYQGVGTTPETTYADLVLLDSALSKSITHQLIPILELHDLTCQNDSAALLSLGSWFAQPAVVTLIDKYKHSLIINVANEALYVNWTGNPTAAQNRFVNTYTSIVNTIRNAGVTVPIMIDGPDCGTNLDVLANVGPTLQLNDPVNNLIFSAHAYWYAFAGNDSTQMHAKLTNAQNAGIPFILGEVANLQDDANPCMYTLNYAPLLRICEQEKIGWIGWSWDHDVCSARQMSTAGNFSSLTAYGTDLVNNPIYGMLANPSAKSEYLLYGGCNTASISNETPTSGVLYPNPSNGVFSIQSNLEVINVLGYDMVGRSIKLQTISKNSYQLISATPGTYMVQIELENHQTIIRKLLIN